VEGVFSFWLKMAPLAQGVGQKLFFCHNFESIQLFCNSFVLSARKLNRRKVFGKIIVGGLFLIFLFQQPTFIFSKTFLPLNLRADNTNLLQKTD
jgi:hypothetical protein